RAWRARWSRPARSNPGAACGARGSKRSGSWERGSWLVPLEAGQRHRQGERVVERREVEEGGIAVDEPLQELDLVRRQGRAEEALVHALREARSIRGPRVADAGAERRRVEELHAPEDAPVAEELRREDPARLERAAPGLEVVRVARG